MTTPTDSSDAGRERFYAAEFLRRWALQLDDVSQRGLVANLAYAVARGHHVDAVINGDLAPPRDDVPSMDELHQWTVAAP